MINNTVGELAAVIQARVEFDGNPPSPEVLGSAVVDLVYDSRKAKPGSIFVAFSGEHQDGHEYAPAAWEAGAVAAITARPVPGGLCLIVDDPQIAMGMIGRHVIKIAKQPRDDHEGLRVIGITGSAGKTTTKDLLAQILERVSAVVAPQESMNNEIGLPTTASWVTAETEYLIAEMGAKGIGHIRYLCEITPPDIGLELNVGQAHIGKFGSQDAIAEAKGELVETLPVDGIAVLNVGDPRVWAMRERTQARLVSYGVEVDGLPDDMPSDWLPDVYATDLIADDLDRWGFELRVGGTVDRVQLQILGIHQVGNAVAAAAAAYAAGVAPSVIMKTLNEVGTRSHWRMELHELDSGAVLINDAYNANPASMSAALATLARIGRVRRASGQPARTIAVLGEMLELGQDSASLHAEVGATAAEFGIDLLISVGAGAAPIVEGAVAAGLDPGAAAEVADRHQAIRLLSDLRPGDVVLIKASRDIGLESVGEHLLQER
jgi:UDP-N-acetylmuramoyl-tripeptide--D-alanyl-D-alanine ligase